MKAVVTLLALLVSACAASGPIVIAPEGARFDGIRDVFSERDAAGAPIAALNIFIVHGMRAQAPQFLPSQGAGEDCDEPGTPTSGDMEGDVRAEIIVRLSLNEVPVRRCTVVLMGEAIPDISIGGRPVWTSLEDWRRDAPFIEIAEHRSTDGRTVRFYGFNYWGMLVRIKCAELVGVDAALIGDSNASAYCAERYGQTIPDRLGSAPLPLNHTLKADLVTWGFGDALLASSPLRRVIRSALREAMAVQLEDVASESAIGDAAPPPLPQVVEDVPAFLESASSQRWVVVTKSLGSWLTLSALTNESDYRAVAQGPVPQAALDAAARATICGSNQIHMLANQVALLRLSDIEVGEGDEASPPSSGGDDPARAIETQCDSRALRPLQVVAYHDPNDLLTFMLPEPDVGDQASAPRQREITFVNVVAPFAPIILPFVVADPARAHDGQKIDRRIMDMVVNGSPPD